MAKRDFEPTAYGFKKAGHSKFVIVAPHGAGDDLKTPLICIKLAEALDAYLVVNSKYHKKNNKQKSNLEFAEDFNRLTWSRKYQKYLWQRKRPAMKKFFKDIEKFCQSARKIDPDQKSVVIYIHGMKNKRTGIDIGVGLKNVKSNNVFLRSCHGDGNNTGLTTIKINQIKQLKKALQDSLKKQYNLEVSVGKKYTGWSKQSAIQFHKHENRNDYSLQLEINYFLRKKANRDFLIQTVSETLIEIF